MISKIKPPIRVKDNDSQRIYDDIYAKLNEIIDAVNQSQKSSTPDTQGKSGDLKVIKKDNNSYAIEGKTEDGWASVDITLNERV